MNRLKSHLTKPRALHNHKKRTVGCEKNSFGAPGKLVAQRVVGALGRREAAAPRIIGHHTATALPNCRDGLERMHVVNARVETDLVQTYYTGLTRTVNERQVL